MKKYANIDVQAMYPAGNPPRAENWTLDTFLKAAEACHKDGYPFGIGLGETGDSVGTAGAIFQSFGAEHGSILLQDRPAGRASDKLSRETFIGGKRPRCRWRPG